MTQFIRTASAWILMIALIVVVIAANSVYTIHTLNELAAVEGRIFTTNKIIDSINALHVAVLRTESGQRGFLLSDNPAYLEDYEKTLNKVNQLIDRVEENAITSDFDDQAERIEQLISLAKQKLNELIKTVELAREDKHRKALAIFNSQIGLDLYDQFETLFNDIAEEERRLQSQHVAALVKLRTDSVNNLIISAATTGLLVIGMFFLLRLNIRETINHRRELEHHNMVLESRVEERTVELKVYSEELARSNRELEDFAFVASHDLQEPLRKIRAFGNRLSTGYQDVLDERGQDFLARMLNAAERMSMLISDLLAFSRVTTRGKDFADTDLNEVVSAVLDDLEIPIEETHAKITVDTLPVMRADPSQMNQLFLNLFSNALKFRLPDITPHISLRCVRVDNTEAKKQNLLPGLDWIKLTLQDNGIGFDQTFAEKIFAPFQRLHGRSEYKGTGIGLAVCRRIVERHNGVISAHSEPGNGARFDFYLPLNGQPFDNVRQQGVIQDAE